MGIAEQTEPPLSARRSLHSTLSKEEADYAELWGGKVGIAMMHGNRVAAHDLVDRGIAEIGRRNKSPLLKTRLSELDIDVVTCNLLESERRISTVEEFLNAKVADMAEAQNLGITRVTNAMQAVAKYALSKAIAAEQK